MRNVSENEMKTSGSNVGWGEKKRMETGVASAPYRKDSEHVWVEMGGKENEKKKKSRQLTC